MTKEHAIYLASYSPWTYHIDELVYDRAKISIGGPMDNMPNHIVQEVRQFLYSTNSWLNSKNVEGTLVKLNVDNKVIKSIELEKWILFNDKKNNFYGVALTGKVKDNIDHSEKGGHYYVQED